MARPGAAWLDFDPAPIIAGRERPRPSQARPVPATYQAVTLTLPSALPTGGTAGGGAALPPPAALGSVTEVPSAFAVAVI